MKSVLLSRSFEFVCKLFIWFFNPKQNKSIGYTKNKKKKLLETSERRFTAENWVRKWDTVCDTDCYRVAILINMAPSSWSVRKIHPLWTNCVDQYCWWVGSECLVFFITLLDLMHHFDNFVLGRLYSEQHGRIFTFCFVTAFVEKHAYIFWHRWQNWYLRMIPSPTCVL